MFVRKTSVAQQTVDPPTLSSECSVKVIATKVLGETLTQFTDQLTALRVSGEPEVVHQARVAWRRFKSDLRLFKPALKPESMPTLTPLQPLLQGLGALRDLDVALTETLPQWRGTYVEGSPKTSAVQARRRRVWRQMCQALQQSADDQRSVVRSELASPAVVATLLALTEWANGLSGASPSVEPATVPLRHWARQRLADWRARFKAAFKSSRHGANPEQQHRVRILAKRLRYGVEALDFLLPVRLSRRWHQQAAALQTRLGGARDLLQAHALATSVTADEDILRFLQHLADQSADLAAAQSS
jgi:CHAD domain-containing protein